MSGIYNRHTQAIIIVKDKIRQQLQNLRDKGVIGFGRRKVYKNT
ncbi:MAG: hypothetical protein IPP76_04810 [Moraxellaceae bacterium]|nr:hypothetical protein [Moraxellaceae bacterium]